MGDADDGPVGLSFNPQLRVEFRGATVTSDAGLVLPRALDERLGLSALIERYLTACAIDRPGATASQRGQSAPEIPGDGQHQAGHGGHGRAGGIGPGNPSGASVENLTLAWIVRER